MSTSTACGLLILLLTGIIPLPAAAACRDLKVADSMVSLAYAADFDVTLQYFGHNFFQMTTRKGTQIVTDPLAPGRYPTPYVAPHVVTVGREHPNHNSVQLVHGTPHILRGLSPDGTEWNRVNTQVREVTIFNVPLYHHGVSGPLKGAAFVFEFEPLCIVHLGDLSHALTPEQLQHIGQVDIALIPIGGMYTMGPELAREVLQQLQPRIAVPMHYWDNRARVEAFVAGLPTRWPDSDTLRVSKSSLPEHTEIIVLRPAGARQE